jgi:hypothetical protein
MGPISVKTIAKDFTKCKDQLRYFFGNVHFLKKVADSMTSNERDVNSVVEMKHV